MSQLPDRYPGIKAFEKNEANLFKGREQEVQELFNMVLAENCVVLFGKSGLGKSSLLNAGLSPLLEARGFLPIPVRLQPSDMQKAQTPVSIFKLNVKSYAGRVHCESCTTEDLAQLPLWEYMKTCVFPMGFTPVFILDQFENFFTHNSREDQEAFLLALKELLHGEVPVRILNWYKSIPSGERTKEQVAWCNQPEIKVIISIREDRLGDLGFVSAYILHVLRSRYQLLPLTLAQAEHAILEPAQQTDRQYASLPYTITTGAKDLILKKLSSGRNTVETTHLQLICHEIECKRKDPPYSAIENLDVDEGFFDGEQGLDDIINNFYARQIKSIISDVQREKAKTLLETKMVQNGKRILYSEDQVNLVLGEDAVQVVSRLLDLRLIRGDYRDEQKIYEISHDSLLVPILAANKDREDLEKEIKIREEREQRQKEIIEQQERIIKLQKQARLKKKATVLAWFSGILLVLTAVFSYLFIKTEQTANKLLFNNVYRYANEYYRNNDHFTAYTLYSKVARTKGDFRDSARDKLALNFFFDVPGGQDFKPLTDSTFAVYHTDKRISFWKVVDGKRVDAVDFGYALPGSVKVSDPYIAYRDLEGTLKIYDTRKADKAIKTLPAIMRFRFPTEKNNAKDAQSGYPKDDQPYDLNTLNNPVAPQVYFSKDNNFLFSADSLGRLGIYDIRKDAMVNIAHLTRDSGDSLFYNPGNSYNFSQIIQPLENGRWLAVNRRKNILLINTENPNTAAGKDTLTGRIVATNKWGVLVYQAPDSTFVFKKTGDKDGKVERFDASRFIFSPDSSAVLMLNRNRTEIAGYSFAKGARFSFTYNTAGIHKTMLSRNMGLNSALITNYFRQQNITWFFLMNRDATAIMYATTDSMLVINRQGIVTPVMPVPEAIAVLYSSPDLDKIAFSGHNDLTLNVYDITKKQLYTPYGDKGEQGIVKRCGFNSTGRYLVYHKEDTFGMKIMIYDIERQKKIMEQYGQFVPRGIFNDRFIQLSKPYTRIFQNGLVLFNNNTEKREHLKSWYPDNSAVLQRFGLQKRNKFLIF